jgi:hypothetical protein
MGAQQRQQRQQREHLDELPLTPSAHVFGEHSSADAAYRSHALLPSAHAAADELRRNPLLHLRSGKTPT